MTMRLLASVASVTVADLSLSWTDCSDDSFLVKMETLTPDTLISGVVNDIKGTGILTRDITEGEGITFASNVEASVIDCHGDLSVGKKCNFPLDMGSLEVLPIATGIKAGEIPLNFDLKISRLLPATLLTTTTKVTGVGKTSGNQMWCTEVYTKRSDDSHIGVGILDVTWADCGDATTKALVHDLQPAQLKQGSIQHITGTGTLSEDIDEEVDVHMDMAVKFLGCNGDGVAGKKCNFPLDMGSFEFVGVQEPLAAGEQSIDVNLKIAKIVPDGSKTTTHVTAQLDSGEQLFCLDVFTDDNNKALV